MKNTLTHGLPATALLTLILAFASFSSASATLTSISFQPSPADLDGLDHHYSYSWRIDNINPSSPITVTSATLTFNNIQNWDTSPNMLFVYLLDTATQSGVNTFQDHPLDEAPIGDIVDHFANGAVIPSLLTASTAKIKLFQQSFTTTPTDFTYTFTSAQLVTLSQYINNGDDLAFGFDPECHFFNDGVNFNMTFAPVPEPASLMPVSILVTVSIFLEARRRRSAVAMARGGGSI